MPRKIIQVPGVPPHQWHKHQPPSAEEEIKQENMAPQEQSVDTKTESIIRQDSTIPVGPKAKKVPIKQWTTTMNDPGRLHRLMLGGYEPLRKCCHFENRTPIDTEPAGAPPKVMPTADHDGRLLYPHEAAAAITAPEPELPVRSYEYQDNTQPHQYLDASRVDEPEPLKASHLPEKWSPETAGVQSQDGNNQRIVAWRDFAAKPESLKNYPQQQKVFESVQTQPRDVTNHGWAPDHDLPDKQAKHSTSNDDAQQAKCGNDNGPFNSDQGHAATSLRRREGTKPVNLGAYPQAEKHCVPVQSSENSGSVAPAPMRSIDLQNLQIPRPDRNYAASVRSMVSVLSLDEDDNARGDNFADGSPVKHTDIRSKIGLEHNLHMSGGKLINTDIWMEKARKPEVAFSSTVYTNPWIEDYVENQIDYAVRADFLYKEDPIVHCHCDVNTFTGELLNPVQYDYTVPDYMNSDSIERQMTSTSSLYMQRKATKPNFRNNNRGPSRRSHGWVDTATPLSSATPESPAPQKQSQPLQRPRAESNSNPFALRVSCHLRPATKDDMEGVRAIYNWEVLNGIQALDTEPLSLADWEGILKKSQNDKLPFVVAIGGSYQPQDKVSQGATKPVPEEELAGKILAFGFLTIRQPGLAGSADGTSRMSAKAHVFVHPGYRRRKLGHICLDKLLSTVSIRYATKLGYEFINIDDNPTYKYPRHHDRKIYSVFVEYFVPRVQGGWGGGTSFSPNETDLKWFEQVITSRYGFWKVARLEAAHRSRTTYEPAPIWLDTVMFEHLCQEGLGFTYQL